ncbi:DUF427 domain-containing protein [Trebonia sp.]|uniref:DUF427 domain-containing protein n=1 Tax=Trebonia sp. TaxID=2767075 RepID=UPI003BB15BA1
MRIRFDNTWIADSEQAILLHEPGHYPVAYLPIEHVEEGVLLPTDRITTHRDLGATRWFTVAGPGRRGERAAWTHTDLPEHASVLAGHVAFAWRAMDGFYEEDERILGHAADNYHRVDIRSSSRHLVVRAAGTTIADTTSPVVLYESGFAPHWYVPRTDVDETALTATQTSTFCPCKGIAGYYSVAGIPDAAWFYRDAFPEAARIDDLVSFEPDKIDVFLDGKQLGVEPGQTVIAHGLDRGLQPDEIAHRDDSGLHNTEGQQ